MNGIFDFGVENKSELRTVDLSQDVEIIEKAKFAECYKLERVLVGKKLQRIEDRAFFRCFELKKMDLINTSLEYIGKEAFAHAGIESLLLPNCLKNIGERAFYCSKLKTVEIPPSVEMIGERALESCKEVTLYDTYRTDGFHVFYDNSDIKYRTDYQDHIVTVKSAETQDIIYQLFLPGNEGDDYQRLVWYCWNDTVNFDFETYDRYFLNLKTDYSKYKIAKCRLKHPMMLKDKYKKLYEQYIKYSDGMKKNWES